MSDKHVRIKVSEKNKEIVSLILPLKALALIDQFIPEDELKKHGIDIEKIVEIVEEKLPEGSVIDIADVYDKNKKLHVEVYVE